MAVKVSKKTPFFSLLSKNGKRMRALVNKFYKTALFDFQNYGFYIYNIEDDFLEKRLSNLFIEIKKRTAC